MAVLESSWVLERFKLCKQEFRDRALFKLNIYYVNGRLNMMVIWGYYLNTLHPRLLLRLMGYLTSQETVATCFQPIGKIYNS